MAQPWESKRKFFLRLVNRLSLIHLRSALQELIQTLIYFLLYQTRLKLVFISAEIIIQYIKPDWNMGTVSKEVLPLSVLKSSHLRCCSVKKVLLKISQKTCNFIKKRFQHSYFPVKIMNTYFKIICKRVPLWIDVATEKVCTLTKLYQIKLKNELDLPTSTRSEQLPSILKKLV